MQKIAVKLLILDDKVNRGFRPLAKGWYNLTDTSHFILCRILLSIGAVLAVVSAMTNKGYLVLQLINITSVLYFVWAVLRWLIPLFEAFDKDFDGDTASIPIHIVKAYSTTAFLRLLTFAYMVAVDIPGRWWLMAAHDFIYIITLHLVTYVSGPKKKSWIRQKIDDIKTVLSLRPAVVPNQ